MTIYKPAISVLPSDKIDKEVTHSIIDLVHKKPNAVLLLPTGKTPLGVYRLLVEACTTKIIDLGSVVIFNLDEYWPIDPENKSSYSFYMRSNLISHSNIKPENWHIFDGSTKDPNEEAKQYEKKLRKYGKPDLALLGIGPGKTCHIGFNERGSDETSHTRYVKLDPETAQTNKQYFDNPKDIPKGALTLGIANILSAKKIILIAKGENKAWGIKRSLEGPINADAPASFLRYHPNVTFFLDTEASSQIRETLPQT